MALRKAGKTPSPRGRHPMLSAESIERLRHAAKVRDMQQNSHTKGSLTKAMEEAAMQDLEERGKNPDALKTPNYATISKYLKMIVPEKVKRPSVQNLRRLEVN